MKYFLLVVLALVVALYTIYSVPQLNAWATNLLTFSVCDSPLQYKLGSIDTRFGLTTAQVLADIKDATAIWSSVEQKNLFAYNPNAPLTVNFVYDERQALDSSINNLDSQLSQNDRALKQEIAQYQADVAAFKQKLAAFNATVDKYNSEGGAPPDVYNQLKQQQQELNAEGDALNKRAQELNLSTNNYNYNVSVLNSDIAQFNNVIAQKPEEGVYDSLHNTITIYFANNKDELFRTLAHEFGHALGMQHVGDKDAIMYPYTNSTLSPTTADIQELTNACKKQSIILHDLEQLDMWIYNQVQQVVQAYGK